MGRKTSKGREKPSRRLCVKAAARLSGASEEVSASVKGEGYLGASAACGGGGGLATGSIAKLSKEFDMASPRVSPIRSGGASVIGGGKPKRKNKHIDEAFSRPAGGSPSGSLSARGSGKKTRRAAAGSGAMTDRSSDARREKLRRALKAAGMAVQGVKRFESAKRGPFGSIYADAAVDTPGPGEYGDVNELTKLSSTARAAPAVGMGVKPAEPEFFKEATRRGEETPGAGSYVAASSFGKQSAPRRVAGRKGGKTAPSYKFSSDATGRGGFHTLTAAKKAGLTSVENPGPGEYASRDLYSKPDYSGVGLSARAKKKPQSFSFGSSPRF